jgi:hypothetical protein
VWVRGLDRRKERAIFALMVSVERGAEAMAVQQEVPAGMVCGNAAAESLPREFESVSDAPVNSSQFGAPGNKSARVALSHAATKGSTYTTSLLRFGASMPDTACHQHATLH